MYGRLLGTGSYLPPQIVTNQDLEKKIDTTDAWIQERTGIKRRHIAAPDETAASMAIEAAKLALSRAEVSKDDIDLIITATCTPNKIFPSVSCQVQHALDIKRGIAFDLSAACAGFVYALSVADHFIKAGTAKRILVIGSEVMSRTVDWEDRSTCVIFGDGAGAVVLGADNEPGILSTHLYADGKYSDLLSLNFPQMGDQQKETYPYVEMSGNRVFKFAVNVLEELVEDTIKVHGLKKSQLDWLVPHQANIRIIQATAKKLNLPMSQVICTIEDQGNTSGASIPLALDKGIQDGRIKRGDSLLLESFGGGFAWGSALVIY